MKKISYEDRDVFIDERSDGYIIHHKTVGPINEMIMPVECNRCHSFYDLCKTEVIHRYQDCTMYKTPCCSQVVDDRMWVTNPAFERIDKQGRKLKDLLRK